MLRLTHLLGLTFVFSIAHGSVAQAGEFGAPVTLEPLLTQLLKTAALDSPQVARALGLKKEVELGNAQDVEALLSALKNKLKQNSQTRITEVEQNQIIEKLQADKGALIELKKFLDTQKGDLRGLPPLRTSLVKLIGDSKYSGVLDDAVELYKANTEALNRAELGSLNAKNNEITVLKTLLVYMVKSLHAKMPENLQMIYPAPIPIAVATDMTTNILLIEENSSGRFLQVPNAGFIFGGELIQERCRGIDCSTFLSFSTQSSVRLSTMVMEYTYRELTGGNFSADEEKIRSEFKEKWGMSEALKEYVAVRPEQDDTLKSGDLILWRWDVAGSKVRSGHVVMLIEPIPGDPNHFVGIEANREDDKSVEGIFVKIFEFNRLGKDRYILRRAPLN